MVTYGDMMTLLLCFFVLLLAMSEIREDEKFQEVVESIQQAFGYQSGVGVIPGRMPSRTVFMQPNRKMHIPNLDNYLGEIATDSIQEESVKAQTVRDGVKIIVGGKVSFKRFDASLTTSAVEALTRVAEMIRGHSNKVEIYGHTTNEPLPADSEFSSFRQLSYARAATVGELLIEAGLDRRQLRFVACGDTEPLVAQAYIEEARAVNRRVEILVREADVKDFQGKRYLILTESQDNG
jgi:chemotaxis protein MotB